VGQLLIGGWNAAGWMAQPTALGDRVGRLIGAVPGHTVLGDTLSVKVFPALAACLALRPERRVILSDSGNFPSDLYMAEGLIRLTGGRHELRVVAPEAVEDAIGDDLAVLLLTEVDYRTGRRHDMARLTARAHAAGGLAVWDLAHSAGALPVDVTGGDGRLRGGLHLQVPQRRARRAGLHRRGAAPRGRSRGALGLARPRRALRLRAGLPPRRGRRAVSRGHASVLALAALDAALDAWDGVDMADLSSASLALGDRLIAGVEAAAPDLALATPREHERRGSQVSFRHPEGYAIVQALIERGVVGDFRAPDILRFGITPLYVGEADIDRAVAVIAEVMAGRLWDKPRHRARRAVT
jgi:kynureninase